MLVEEGFGPYEAAEIASTKATAVAVIIRRGDQGALPFEISARDPRRLIGKARRRAGESDAVARLRARHGFLAEMRLAAYSLGADDFERLCARLMLAFGASHAIAQTANDDGGVDVYGRIPVRLAPAEIPRTLLAGALFDKELLFLAQCKCYEPSTPIGPGEVGKFFGQVEACLDKYRGNASPPSHRVPDDYYRRREAALKVIFSTCLFSDRAHGLADQGDIVLVGGDRIAQYLVALGVGFASDGDSEYLKPELVAEWARVEASRGR
jgi:hypothetical protein